MNPRSALAVLACLLLTAAPSFGQEPIEQEQIESGELFRQFIEDQARALSLDDAQDRDLRELVGMILKVRVCSVLKLEETKCLSVMARIGGDIDKIHNLKWERGSVKYFLRRLPEIAKKPSEEVINRRYEHSKELDLEIAELAQTIAGKTEALLTLEQQIAFYVFLGDFENEMIRLARKSERIAERNRALEDDAGPSRDDN